MSMEAAWKNIAHSFVPKPVSCDVFTKYAAAEKQATNREAEFVSMVASTISKSSIFCAWQQDQLECLVPMARLHSVISNGEDRHGFEDANESNILLSKLKSKQFEPHRACCQPEHIDHTRRCERTILFILDGALTIHEKNSASHLTKGQSMVLSHCNETKSASTSSAVCPSDGLLEAISLEFGDISYSSKKAFFLLLSENAIKSVAKTTLMSSSVEFSLNGDGVIRSQKITLDAICQAPHCKTSVFYPGDVHTASPSNGMLSIIVCGQCSQSQGENLASRLKDTCNIRQIALTEELSLSQVVFLASKEKRNRDDCLKLKQISGHPSKGFYSGPPNNHSCKEPNLIKPEIIFQNTESASAAGTYLQAKFSAGENENEVPTEVMAKTERCVENPFLMVLPAFSSQNLESTLPQSPSVLKSKGLLRKSAERFQRLPPFLAKSIVSPPAHVLIRVDEADLISDRQISRNTAFWGYTPDLQTPLSDAKCYWALLRLFVYSCTKKVQALLGKGQSLDVLPLCGIQNKCRSGQLFHKFRTISVVYTIPCSEALPIFNPFLHAISRVASWQNVLCVKTYFRNSENIENLINGTRNLKCFSCIPESTRRVLLNRCSFEEWPSGALILSTISSKPRMCFVIDGDAAAFSSLQKDATYSIQQDDKVTQRYIPGDVLSQRNINLAYFNEPRKIEHVYAGLEGAKVLSVPFATQEELLKPLWEAELNVKLRCFQASQLSAGFSEGALMKVLSQCRIVDISNQQTQLEFSDSCIYLVVEGFMRVSGSAPMLVNHNVGKGMMKDILSQKGMVSMVDSSSPPSTLEKRLQRKLAASPKYSRSHLKFHVADISSPHIFRVCSHHSDQKCPIAACWKFAQYSCPLATTVLEVPLQQLPHKHLSDVLMASDLARTRLWNLFLQIRSSMVPHLDTSSGHASLSLEMGKGNVKVTPLEKTRIDKLAVPFERNQITQKACDFTIYSQKDSWQEVVDTANHLKALEAARSNLSSIEKLKLNRLSAPSTEFSDEPNSTSSSNPLELNSFLYDAAAIASPTVLYNEHSELRSISSQPRTSSLKMWSKGLKQMAVSVVEPSNRVLFLADKEDRSNKLTQQEENEFEEFCSILKEQSQNPIIRDSRKLRKFVAKFGDGMVRSQTFVRATWCFDLQ